MVCLLMHSMPSSWSKISTIGGITLLLLTWWEIVWICTKVALKNSTILSP
jgi:hypothetical protein